MSDSTYLQGLSSINNLTPELKSFFNETRNRLKGHERRQFMAQVVSLLGYGGQLKAEQELGWDRKTIIKGTKELQSGIQCLDNFSGRGRKNCEEHLSSLLEDIKKIVEPMTQTDPTFRTTNLYAPITAKEVRQKLIDTKNYTEKELPGIRTILNKLNQLGYKLKKVEKSKPKKKIAETDAIFEHVHNANELADETDGIIRLSIDAKASIKVGAFSRGGYSRCNTQALDHDFEPDCILKLFGINIPSLDENYMYFTESFITPDFMIDALESLWPSLKERFDPHTILINLDNGPDNNSYRTQWIKRLIEFAKSKSVSISLAYYPPYHSKYNPIERVWGALEKHWNGELLDSVDKVLGLCRTMLWKGNAPVVKMISDVYAKGVTLTKKAMEKLEQFLIRIPGVEKWAVDIPGYE